MTFRPSPPLRRSAFLSALGSIAAAGCVGTAIAAKTYPVTHTDAEWRAILGSARYRVLRQGIDDPHPSNPLLAENRAGIYHCAGCTLAVFASKKKQRSDDGWLVFSDAEGAAVSFGTGMKADVKCNGCGGHLGLRRRPPSSDVADAASKDAFYVDPLAVTFATA